MCSTHSKHYKQGMANASLQAQGKWREAGERRRGFIQPLMVAQNQEDFSFQEALHWKSQERPW